MSGLQLYSSTADPQATLCKLAFASSVSSEVSDQLRPQSIRVVQALAALVHMFLQQITL